MDTNSSEEKHHKKTVTGAVIGGIILAAVLIFTGIWISRSTQLSTNEAVHSVSRYYLQQLAGRCKHVVESKMENATLDVKNAISTIDAEDLQSQESLQNWIRKMEVICDTRELSVLCRNGALYTARGVTHIVQTHNSPKVDGKSNEIVLSIPVDDINFLDSQIFTVFTKIDLNETIDRKAMPMCAEEDTICNLYAKDGTPLTPFMDEIFTNEKNLFRAIQNLNFTDDSSVMTLNKDFADGSTGMTSFIWDGKETLLFYAPIKNSDWILTCFVRENRIGDQVAGISKEMLDRSTIQIALTIIIMMIICAFLIKQSRRTSELIYEKELTEAESRVKQAEMEEKLTLQNKLLEEERRHHRQDEMIRALSSDYRTVYYYNLDTDEGICYRSTPGISSYKEGDVIPSFSEFMNRYVEQYITEADKADTAKFISTQNLKERLKTENIISHRFLTERDGQTYYAMLRAARIDDSPEIHAIGIGFVNVDEQTREAMAKNQALALALEQAQQANISKTTFLSRLYDNGA